MQCISEEDYSGQSKIAYKKFVFNQLFYLRKSDNIEHSYSLCNILSYSLCNRLGYRKLR